MSNSDKLIVVTGATGQQGGATAKHLLKQGWRVRALTRDPQGAAAQALAFAGAEVVAGNMDDRASLDQAFAGAYGVFSVQNFWLPDVGAAGEVRQGKIVADAAEGSRCPAFRLHIGGRRRAEDGAVALRQQMADRAICPIAGPARHDPASGILHGESDIAHDGTARRCAGERSEADHLAADDRGGGYRVFRGTGLCPPAGVHRKGDRARRRRPDHAASCRNHDPRDGPAGAVCRSAAGASSRVQPGDRRHVGVVQRPRL